MGRIPWAVGFVLLLMPAAAKAQQGQRNVVSIVMEMNDRAEAFFRGSDYVASLEVMERAQALRPHPRRTYNMAVCHERLGHLEEAIALLREFIDSPRAPSTWRARAEARLSRLLDKLALQNEHET